MPRLSIGLRWTLRYTAAMLALVLAMGAVYHRLVQDHARGDARLLLELQANEIREAVERAAVHGLESPELTAYIDQHVDSAQEDLRLGIRVRDALGRPVLERGSFRALELTIPGDPQALARERRIVELDVGESFPYAILHAPLETGTVEVAVSTRSFLRGIRDLRNSFLRTLPLALGLSLLVGWWLARGSLAPIARITETARRITASQLDERIPTSGTGDELDALVEQLNAMIARVRAGVERLRSFSSTAAHQLRTPLSLLRSRLEIAALAAREPEADQALVASALRDVERLTDAVRGMLRLADSEGGLRPEQRRPVDVAPLLREIVEFFEPVATEKGVALRAGELSHAVVTGDADWLGELFSNLVDNAVKYTPKGGTVEVDARQEAGRVVVSVRDTGPGIPAGELDRLFERFERGASGGVAGVGLGLTIAREIALAHEGVIRVWSDPGHGSTFGVWLPLREGCAADAAGTSPSRTSEAPTPPPRAAASVRRD